MMYVLLHIMYVLYYTSCMCFTAVADDRRPLDYTSCMSFSSSIHVKIYADKLLRVVGVSFTQCFVPQRYGFVYP